MKKLLQKIRVRSTINPTDKLHRVAYNRQWEFTFRQFAIGGFIGGLIAVIFMTDLLGTDNTSNVIAAVGALFAALALTTASDAELQSRRDTYRAEREALETELLRQLTEAGPEHRERMELDFRSFAAAGRQPRWHHATLAYREQQRARVLNSLDAKNHPLPELQVDSAAEQTPTPK